MAHPGEPPLYNLEALQLTLVRQRKIVDSIRGQLEQAEKYEEELKVLIRMKENGRMN